MQNFSNYDLILAAGNQNLYQAAVLIASAVGSWLILRDSKAWPLDPAQKRSIFICALLGSLAGAALPAFFAGEFVEWQAEHYFVGPKTIIGGLLFSFFSVAVYKRAAGIAYDTSDAFARGCAIMMAIGRLGCFAGHCCFGIPVKFGGMDFGDGVPRIPVQLIEALFLFVLFIAVNELHRKDLYRGRRLFILFFVYGLGRFFLEFLREPIAGSFVGLGYYQWLAFFLAGVGAFQLIVRAHRISKASTH